MADVAEAEADDEEDNEDEGEFLFEDFDEESDDDEEVKMLAVDPDFSSCGTGWLDMDDSCHRSIQIALQQAECRREEARAKLLKTPSDARSEKTAAFLYDLCCHQADSVRVELQKYEDEGFVRSPLCSIAISSC